MKAINWNEKFEYLLNTRWLYYNDDYLKFLVDFVWCIKDSVNIIDFGCGYGYLGIKLLPLLPKGSTYTGVDQSEELLKQAHEIFKSTDFTVQFINADINTYKVDRKYDIALCHAVMLHMKAPEKILELMMDSVKNHGRVICFEPNWIANMSNIYLEGTDQSTVVNLGILQKLYENMAKTNKKDGNIGIKLPIVMSRLGLKDVQCRMSDRVNFVDQNIKPMARKKLMKSLSEDGLGSAPKDPEALIKHLITSGLTSKEANLQYEAEVLLSELFNDDAWLTYAPSMKISFGKVNR